MAAPSGAPRRRRAPTSSDGRGPARAAPALPRDPSPAARGGNRYSARASPRCRQTWQPPPRDPDPASLPCSSPQPRSGGPPGLRAQGWTGTRLTPRLVYSGFRSSSANSPTRPTFSRLRTELLGIWERCNIWAQGELVLALGAGRGGTWLSLPQPAERCPCRRPLTSVGFEIRS